MLELNLTNIKYAGGEKIASTYVDIPDDDLKYFVTKNDLNQISSVINSNNAVLQDIFTNYLDRSYLSD